MRFVSYSTRDGEPTPAILWQQQIFALPDLFEKVNGQLPVSVIELAGDPECRHALEEALEQGRISAVTAAESRLFSPIPRPGKILALAANYPEHVAEVGERPRKKDSAIPHVFPKLPSSLRGPGDPITIPSVSDAVDYEIELGVVIGRAASGVPVQAALEHVAGYVIFNDVSARQVVFPNRPVPDPDDGFWDFLYGKWCDGFALIGPWFVTADEIPDYKQLQMALSVNGVVRQNERVGEMIFDVSEALSFISTICTLEPGDLLTMGTPSGIGEFSAGGFLAPGDKVVAQIEGLGVLENEVVLASSASLPAP